MENASDWSYWDHYHLFVQLEYSNRELRITLEVVERLVAHENAPNAAQHVSFLDKMLGTLMRFLAQVRPAELVRAFRFMPKADLLNLAYGQSLNLRLRG